MQTEHVHVSNPFKKNHKINCSKIIHVQWNPSKKDTLN